MTDYSKLVEELRHIGIHQDCNECEAGRWHNEFDCCLFKDAADAIEALQAEVERLKASNEELRERQTFIDHYGTEWMTSAKDVPTAAYEHGYADGKAEERAKMQKRNAELHAELERWVSAAEKAGEPKLGEWELIDGAEPMRWGCSKCKYLSWETSSYCPRCGAKMNDSNASNALNALDNAQDGPIITPCRGCSDYDGYGGCKSKGGCARAKMEVQE